MSYQYILKNFKLKSYIHPTQHEWVEVYTNGNKMYYCVWFDSNNSEVPSTIITYENKLD